MKHEHPKWYVSKSLVPNDSNCHVAGLEKQSAVGCSRVDQALIESQIGLAFLHLSVSDSAKASFQLLKILPASTQRIALSDNPKIFQVLSGVRKVEPIKRGGKPRAAKDRIETETEVTSKPEIICWKRGMQWMVGIEVPEYSLNGTPLGLLQNESPLAQDSSHEDRWLLEQPFGTVMVQREEDMGKSKTIVAFGEKGYLLFKLSGRDLSFGRRIKTPSSGWYLVVAPENWHRNEALSGPAPVAPESVSLNGYRVHFFAFETHDDCKIGFSTSTSKPVVIKSKGPRFELVGIQITDAREDIGPLFGERPPNIRALDDRAWKNVRTVVVGEEGLGRGRWRAQFTPIQSQIDQELPNELADRKGGWFFLRFYDMNNDLVESIDFRFLKALKMVKFVPPPPLPTEVGHQAVNVEICHEPDCSIQPCDDSLTDVQIETTEEKTVLIIPSRQNYDETRWRIKSEAKFQVELTILVDRVWWGIGEEYGGAVEWSDKTVSLSIHDFRATSDKAVWVLFQRPRLADTVYVGFSHLNARPYRVQAAKKTVCIPLRDYCDANELRIPGVNALRLWVRYHGTDYAATLCELKVKANCKWCDFSTERVDELFCHIESAHLDTLLNEFFYLLAYEKIRDIMPELPAQIYKCCYCDFYVKSDDQQNPTSAITKHTAEYCEKVRHDLGPVSPYFRVISDINEIRKNVINNLPRIFSCVECGDRLRNPGKTVLMNHLIQKHKDVLFDPS